MEIKIGHASIDENGKISGGKIGDQSAKEIFIRNWYSKPWNVLLICKDKPLAKRAADFMKSICKDDNYGYDQGQRISGYNSIVKNGGAVKGAKGEFDCSSLVATCYKLAGLDISVASTTRNMRNNLMRTGRFELYTDKKYLITDDYAQVGAVYLKEGSHVVMALEDGKANYAPTKAITPKSSKEDIKWAQEKLNKALPTWFPKLKVDGDYGAKTRLAVLVYWDSLGWAKHMRDDGTKIGTSTREYLAKI